MTEAPPISPAASSAGADKARIWALVPCAGSGTRAAGALPKQYQLLAGQALVLHTLAAFAAVERVVLALVVVAPGDVFLSRAVQHARQRWCTRPCGGATRAQSVARGLAALQELGAASDDWVLVHDAARCLVTPQSINQLIDACAYDAVGGLLACPVPDTLKLAREGRVLATPDRSHQWLAQTPQMFRIGMLRRALQTAGDLVTDESGAIEALGLSPKLVPGSSLNFKITYPEDFALAQAVLRDRARHPTHHQNYDYP